MRRRGAVTAGPPVFDARLGFYLRADSDDLGNYKNARMHRKLPVSGRTVLDLGANIGAVAYFMLKQGAARVVAVEPDPDNLVVLRLNLNGCVEAGQAVIVPAAVAAETGLTATLWKNQGLNKGMHSLVKRRGRTAVNVTTVALTDLLETYKPEAVKIDIEGFEYVILGLDHSFIWPEYVKALSVEWHHNDAKQKNDWPVYHQALLNQGFSVIHAPRAGGWSSVGLYERS